jgi:hypothetical protein
MSTQGVQPGWYPDPNTEGVQVPERDPSSPHRPSSADPVPVPGSVNEVRLAESIVGIIAAIFAPLIGLALGIVLMIT